MDSTAVSNAPGGWLYIEGKEMTIQLLTSPRVIGGTENQLLISGYNNHISSQLIASSNLVLKIHVIDKAVIELVLLFGVLRGR